MDINNFEVYCINLDERQDRWQESQLEFSQFTVEKVHRFPAIVDNNPIIGCAKSHFEVLKRCLKTKKHCMIFEDDVHFINNFKEFPLFLQELEWLEWDMLYLGANMTTLIFPVLNKPYLGQIYHAQSTHAYCVHREFIPTILRFEHLIGKHMDLIYAEDIIPNHNCYITIPMLATQRPSFSNVEQRMVNYDWMEDRYKACLTSSERNLY